MMAIDFGNWFSIKLSSIESYHNMIHVSYTLSINEGLLILFFHFYINML